jgi:hypothetical protein
MSIKGTNFFVSRLRKLADHDSLSPKLRLLVTLMLAHLDGHEWAMELIKENFGVPSTIASKIRKGIEDLKEAQSEDIDKQQIKAFLATLEEGNGANTANTTDATNSNPTSSTAGSN